MGLKKKKRHVYKMNEGQEGQNIEDLSFMIHFNMFIFSLFFSFFFPPRACMFYE